MNNIDSININYSDPKNIDNRKILYYYKSLMDFSFKDFVKDIFNIDTLDELPDGILKCKKICIKFLPNCYTDITNKINDYISDKISNMIADNINIDKFRNIICMNIDIFIDEFIDDDCIYIEYINKD